ncbi:MAG: FAD:protein FMN transferase [Salinivirgaceae bacterium]|nr:FAD:protein FMN transferase [Salinivirgaceae bacterium]
MKYIITILSIGLLFSCQQNKKTWHFDKGMAHGTFYSVTYFSNKNLQDNLESVMKRTDQSLSTYQQTSIISRINAGDTSVILDSLFMEVFDRGKEIWKNTYGAFDMTVAPLVNAWGFGYEKGFIHPQNSIDSIMKDVGFEHISRNGTKIIKHRPNIKLDANAIAKGYSVDRIGLYLESKNIEDYMVEIGGEVRVRGKSPKDLSWRIGIDNPSDTPDTNAERQIEAILNLKHGAIATSGNYRQFYIKDGKRYAHTINPKTGFPIQHDLLSVTVWAPNCMTADAYATAFMVLGYEISNDIVTNTDSLEAYFILTGEKQKFEIKYTNGIESMLE